MPWFHDKRVDRTLRKEQRQAASPRAGGLGPPSRSRTRSRSRSRPVTRAQLAYLEARISDLETAIEDLEDDADKWASWWDSWKQFLTLMWYRFRYMT